MQNAEVLNQLDRLNSIGVALSAEPDNNRLLEIILLGAKELTNADGGTLYLVTEDAKLKFEIMRTLSLDIAMGGTTGKPIPFPPLSIYLADGKPNTSMVAAYSVINAKTVNIADAYLTEGFDFSGTRKFDDKTGYRSKSFLTVPIMRTRLLACYNSSMQLIRLAKKSFRFQIRISAWSSLLPRRQRWRLPIKI
jgi:hypothetical protein